MKVIKLVMVNEQSYTLSVDSIKNGKHLAILSVENEPSTYFEKKFLTLGELRDGLQIWIINCHQSLNCESEIDLYQNLEEWDGVIEV